MKLEEEKTRMEAEVKGELLKKKEARIQIERASLKMQQEKVADEATRLKKYADALRVVVQCCADDNQKAPQGGCGHRHQHARLR